MRNDSHRDIPRTLGLTLILWSGAVTAGTHAGVFARLDGGAYAALVAFTVAYSAAVVLADRRLAAWLAARAGTVAAIAAAGALAILLAAGSVLGGVVAFDAAGALWAPVLLFVLPVTLATATAGIRAALGAGMARAGCVIQAARG